MKKKIEDYLHLYLGCECICTNEPEKKPIELTCVEPVSKKAWMITGVSYHTDVVKPILRPLSSMTEDEAHTIYKKYFGKDFADDWSGDTGSAYFNPKRRKIIAADGIKIIEGIDYETGDFMKVVSIVPYLLSKHFDLFGLIDAGLAIDKTKMSS